MAIQVSLSSAVRDNLLTLQGTTDLIGRTQGRLSSGLRVSGPTDDPVAFFQAKGLNDRSADFTEKKAGIDQGISTITAATDAIDAIESLVQQLKGLIINAKSATTATSVDSIIAQFNDLRTQVDLLTSDASYQGLNLVDGTGQTLTVNFSNDTASILNVASVDITTGVDGLNVIALSATTDVDGISINTNAYSAGIVSAGTELVFTVANGGDTAAISGDTFTVQVGTESFTITVGSTGAATAQGILALSEASALADGGTITLTVGTDAATDTVSIGAISLAITSVAAVNKVGVGFTTELSARVTNLDSALTTLRSKAQTLGSNVALLQTRLDFTKNYINTLTSGAGKLTLADLNEEGANLLALQTRQQLGIQSLAFAGQSEQAILGLFR